MEVMLSSETSEDFYRATWPYNPEDRTVQQYEDRARYLSPMAITVPVKLQTQLTSSSGIIMLRF
jgi:hypothetical protein